MLPLNQSRKIALIAVALFMVSMGILFIFTQNNGLISGDLKTQLFGAESSKYENIVKNSADPVVVIGAENKISYVSPSFRDLLGYEDVDLNGVDFFNFVHPDDAGDVASLIAKISQEKTEMKNLGPYRIKDKSGQYGVYMAGASVVSSENKVLQIIITMKDITKSVEDINKEKEAGKPIKTMKNEPDKKIMVDKG